MATPASLSIFINKLCVTAATLVLALATTVPAQTVDTDTVNNTVNTEPKEPTTRLNWLRAEIARHDELYFKQNTSVISDETYDSLKRELLNEEKILAHSGVRVPQEDPTSSIGDDRSGGLHFATHRQPMLSLEKAYTTSELREFIHRVEQSSGRRELRWVVEPKFDGLAISVTYEYGRLVRAVTRGNGKQGDDVTDNVLTIPTLPRTLPTGFPQVVEIRGEVFINDAEFSRLNAEREEAGEPPYANPRNLAAGTLKLHDPLEVSKRHLSIVFYGLGAWEGPPAKPVSQQALHAQVRAWNLPGVESPVITQTSDAVCAAVMRLGRQRSTLGFPTDGAVVKLNDTALQQELGDSNEAPRWAIAYKFAPERATTRLLAITLQVGRTGIITPVAELEPVVLGGTTIGRATLYNADAIARRDLRIGDWVSVEKAGEIIPRVTGADPSRRPPTSEPFLFPQKCPACAGNLVRNEGETTTRCVQPNCEGQLRRRIEHYVSPEAVGIKGMGPTLIAALVEAKRIKTVADIYRLQRDDLVNIGGVSNLVADQLLEQIETSKSTGLDRLIYGLSIPGIGRKAAEKWAERFTNLREWAEAKDVASNKTDSTASNTAAAFLSLTQIRALITDLIDLGVNAKSPLRPSTLSPLSGTTVVITGALHGLTRAEAKKQIEEAGGHVTDSVSRSTDVVVAGEGAGAKLTQARALGIEVINEANLRQKLTQ